MSGPHTETSVEQLETRLACDWSALREAREQAQVITNNLADSLSLAPEERLIPEDEAGVVVFGSLARNEWTKDSDVDWTLLIDGPADPHHRSIAHFISEKLEAEELREPGPTGMFGNMAFSHDIIHQIGGQRDTNQNTTQRILLLLESKPLICNLVYKRVICSVLRRYLDDDISLLSRGGRKYKIPRFLLNDIVRYWRTMAVDYAHKRYERASKGWALRNIKLRMSRKLIFVSGLLTCFNCYLNPSPGIKDASEGRADPSTALVSHLVKYVEMTPLDVLAQALNAYASEKTAILVMDSYNTFMSRISDVEIRTHLDGLKVAEADQDTIFNNLCDVSRQFQKGLTQFFFFENEQISELIRKYGVF